MKSASDQPSRNDHCPKCKNTELDRIPRGPVFKNIFPWVKVRHYRCMRCHRKFYRFQ